MMIRSRELRKRLTPAEKVFWSRVRNRRFNGHKFNRQYVIRYDIDRSSSLFYIVDYYCHAKKLVVEIDGAIHDTMIESDLLRDNRIKELGYRVIRFKNEEVLFNWPSVKYKLEQALKSE